MRPMGSRLDKFQFRKKYTASFLPKHRREVSEGEQTQMSGVTMKYNLELQGKPAGAGEWDVWLSSIRDWGRGRTQKNWPLNPESAGRWQEGKGVFFLAFPSEPACGRPSPNPHVAPGVNPGVWVGCGQVLEKAFSRSSRDQTLAFKEQVSGRVSCGKCFSGIWKCSKPDLLPEFPLPLFKTLLNLFFFSSLCVQVFLWATWVQYLRRLEEEGIWCLGTEVRDSCGQSRGCWESNTDLLDGEKMCLIAEPSL